MFREALTEADVLSLPPSPFLKKTQEPTLYIMGPWPNFAINYVINGEMRQGLRDWRYNQVSMRSNAHGTSSTISRFVEKYDGKIIKPFADPRYPDQIFAADPVLSFINQSGEKIALMSRMKYQERQGEVSKMRQLLRSAGFHIVESDLIREGSGDAVFDANLGIWCMGVGERTAPGAGKLLSELSGRSVIEIPTTDPFLYHCDTFMSPLPGGHKVEGEISRGHLVRYKGAMVSVAVEIQNLLYPHQDQILDVDKCDAMAFAANLQTVTDERNPSSPIHHILAPDDLSSRVYNQLSQWGYATQKISINAIRAAGGGPHCVLQKVWDLRKHPLEAFPAHFAATVERLNRGQHEKLKVRIWDNGRQLGSASQPGPQAPVAQI